MSKKYHIVYKTINLVNNKCYVGVHSTNKIDDSYIGCGVGVGYDPDKFKAPRGIKVAFKKYGMHNFKKEILYIFDTREEAFEKEAEIVNLDWVKSHDNYNLCLGGKNSGVTIMPEDIKKKLIDINSRSYVVVNLQTNDVFFVKNLNEWSRERGLCYHGKNSILFRVLQGKSKTYNNTWWICRESDWTGQVVIPERKKSYVRKRNYKKRPDTKTHMNIVLYNPYGEKVFIDDLVDFCRDNNVDYSSFVKLSKNKVSQAKYWTTSIENHLKVVSYFLLDGKKLRIENIKKYCRENKLDSKSMFNLKNKKTDSYKGYTRYEHEI